MKHILITILVLISTVCYGQFQRGQGIEDPAPAQDFLLTFLNHEEYHKGFEFIYLSALEDTTDIVVTCKAYPSFIRRYRLAPHTDTIVKYTDFNEIYVVISESEEITGKAVRVRSSSPIICIGYNYQSSAGEFYAAVSEDMAGSYYKILSYRSYRPYPMYASFNPHFSISAYYPETNVTIVPTASTQKGSPAGTPLQFTLDSGETVYIRSEGIKNPYILQDLTGSTVVSNKPVAVYAGHRCVVVPYDDTINMIVSRNFGNVIESIPPVSRWGKGYVFTNFAQVPYPEFVRVVSSQNGTNVLLNGTLWKGGMAEGEYADTLLQGTVLIEADRPVLAATFSCSLQGPIESYLDTSFGTVLATLPPLETRCSDQIFYVQSDSLFQNNPAIKQPVYSPQYVQIAVERSNKGKVRLDGELIPEELFTDVPGAYDGKQFSVGSVRLGPHKGKQYRLTVPGKDENGFVFIVHGAEAQYGSGEAYAYGSQMLYRRTDALSVPVEPYVSGDLVVSSVYPNPADGNVTVTYRMTETGNVEMILFDVLGNEVQRYPSHRRTLGKHSDELALPKLTAGMYYLQICTGVNRQTLPLLLR